MIILKKKKHTKNLEITLTKEVKDLQIENYKTLLQGIEEDTKKWKDISSSEIERTNVIKMATLVKTIYRFSAISVKNFNDILQTNGANAAEVHKESHKTMNRQNY